ncbi:MAG: prepilin-type N-terminal cleavage/methylation domain-containing protein [Bradymonadales bacterium]|nr:MAG: prepilin-type N-terminal cleavage/methylation domain-containing protein [Bradymonadales bacterium]
MGYRPFAQEISFGATRGMTIIELLLVVTIIGILAATAGSAFDGYRKRAMTQEPLRLLPMMAGGIVTYYGREDEFIPLGPTNVPPTNGSTARSVDFLENPEWNWIRINFSISDPIRYGYQGSQTGPGSYLLEALGDLNSNGILSIFSISIFTTGERTQISPVHIFNELE